MDQFVRNVGCGLASLAFSGLVVLGAIVFILGVLGKVLGAFH